MRQMPLDASLKPYFIRWAKLRDRLWAAFHVRSELRFLRLKRRIVGRVVVVVVVVVDIVRGNDCCAVFGIAARAMRWDAALNIVYIPTLFRSCREFLETNRYPNGGKRRCAGLRFAMRRRLSAGDFGGAPAFAAMTSDQRPTTPCIYFKQHFKSSNPYGKMCGRYSLGIVRISDFLS